MSDTGEAGDDIERSPNPSIHSSHSDDITGGYDMLDDIDKHKDIYRLKVRTGVNVLIMSNALHEFTATCLLGASYLFLRLL